MHLQCFPPTLRERALFGKRVLLLAEYGPGCSTWFLDVLFLHVHTHAQTHTLAMVIHHFAIKSTTTDMELS